MKAGKKITIAGVIVTVIFGFTFLYSIIPQHVQIRTSSAQLIYISGDIQFKESLANEEALAVYAVFNGKTLKDDSPTLAFTSNVSIRFGEQIFCIACDGSPVVKLQNKDKFFEIGEADRQLIESLFERFGGIFPCV
ncbi:MAG TPA: hypothetical protein VFD23_02420 [Clostridia bacterium]|nr:hypothetical protein [Clostridia bacterium]